MNSKEQRILGWGYIGGGLATLGAWWVMAALGHEPTIGLTFGSIGIGAWKVFHNRENPIIFKI